MDKFIIDDIDIFNPVSGKMHEIINAFVEFYGEEYRSRIEEKLNNVRTYFVSKEVGFKNLGESVESYYNKKLQNIENNFFSEIVGKEVLDKVNEGFFILSINDLFGLEKKLNDKYIPYGFNKILTFLGYSYPVDYFNNKQNVEKFFQDKSLKSEIVLKVKKIQSLWNEKYKNIFNKIKKESEKKVEQAQKIIKSNDKIDDYYNTEIINLFNVNIPQYINGYDKLNKSEQNKMINTFVDLLHNKNFETLNDKQNNTKFFNRLGILHYNYEDYFKDEKFKKIFNEDLYLKYKEIIVNVAKKSFYNNYFVQEILKDFIEEDNILGINNFARSLYNYIFSDSYVGAFVSGLVKNDKEQFICLLPDGINLSDYLMIHEFNHLIENDIIKVENQYKLLSGFDSYNIDSKETKLDADKIFNVNQIRTKNACCRRYEFINEVINDYFSTKIINIFAKNNFNIGKNINQITNSTYSLAFPLLEDFIEENKDLLTKSRLTKNHNFFAQFIGQENFDRLAECVTKFLSYSSWERAELYTRIKEKTGIIKIGELKNLSNLNFEFNEKEQSIIDAFKTVKEISEIVKEKRQELKMETEVEHC